MDAAAEAAAIEAALRAAGTPERAVNEKAYLKSDLEFAGTSVPTMRATIRSWCKNQPGLARADMLAVARALWGRPVHDCRMASVELLTASPGLLRAEDSLLLETMLRTARTWALVDKLAASVMGPLVERYPELGGTLDRWAADHDFWLRRSALLALLGPLRRGGGDFARFSRYADSMLDEKEFFIRKAIGWIRAETGARLAAAAADRALAADVRTVNRELSALRSAAGRGCHTGGPPRSSRQ